MNIKRLITTTLASIAMSAVSLAGWDNPVDFYYQDISGVDFTTSDLVYDGYYQNGVLYRDLDLSAGYFGYAIANGASFAGKDLSYANFDRANLTNASFRGADLTGAYFVDANMTGADFTDARVTGACFFNNLLVGSDNTIFSAFVKKQLLSTATWKNNEPLTDMAFGGVTIAPSNGRVGLADFSDLDWSDRDLSGTVFELANLQNGDFANANLEYTQFNFVDLRGATNFPLDDADALGMYFSNWIHPDGTIMMCANEPGFTDGFIVPAASDIDAVLTVDTFIRRPVRERPPGAWIWIDIWFSYLAAPAGGTMRINPDVTLEMDDLVMALQVDAESHGKIKVEGTMDCTRTGLIAGVVALTSDVFANSTTREVQIIEVADGGQFLINGEPIGEGEVEINLAQFIDEDGYLNLDVDLEGVPPFLTVMYSANPDPAKTLFYVDNGGGYELYEDTYTIRWDATGVYLVYNGEYSGVRPATIEEVIVDEYTVTITGSSRNKSGHFAVFAAQSLDAEEDEWELVGEYEDDADLEVIEADGSFSITFDKQGEQSFYRVATVNADFTAIAYSSNVGGYYTLDLPGGIDQLVVNQFDRDDKMASAIFAALDAGSTITYPNGSQTVRDARNGNWVGDAQVPAGVPVLVYAAEATSVVFSGTLESGTYHPYETVAPNKTRRACSMLPIGGSTEAMGIPVEDGLVVTLVDLNGRGVDYTVDPRTGAWSAPGLKLGQAFLLTFPRGMDYWQELTLSAESVAPTLSLGSN